MSVIEQTRDRSGTVQSVSRAVGLLRIIAASGSGATLKAIACEAGLAPSTVHRLLTTLQSERFVRFDNERGLWQVGVGAFAVGSAFLRARDVVTIAMPYLRRLMEATKETANIYVAQEGLAVCVAQVESPHTMRALTRVGGRVPLAQSGAGKAIIAFTPELSYLCEPERLDLIRANGFAVDDEEFAEGLRCIGAPVFDEIGRAVAAISVSGPSSRIAQDKLAPMGRLVTEMAADITTEIGGIACAAE